MNIKKKRSMISQRKPSDLIANLVINSIQHENFHYEPCYTVQPPNEREKDAYIYINECIKRHHRVE